MTKLLRSLARLAFRRGVVGGSRDWAVLWVLASLWAKSRAKSDEPPPVVHREVLSPGESVRISLFDPRSIK